MKEDEILMAIDPKNSQCATCKRFYHVEKTDKLLFITRYPRIRDNGDNDCFTCGWDHNFCWVKTKKCNISMENIEESYNNRYSIIYDNLTSRFIFTKR